MSNLRELPDGTIQKQCARCQTWRRIPEGFGLRRKSADGFESWCHVCRAEVHLEWQRANPDRVKSYNRKASTKTYAKGGKVNTHLD
jgi:hypothetical protein